MTSVIELHQLIHDLLGAYGVDSARVANFSLVAGKYPQLVADVAVGKSVRDANGDRVVETERRTFDFPGARP